MKSGALLDHCLIQTCNWTTSFMRTWYAYHWLFLMGLGAVSVDSHMVGQEKYFLVAQTPYVL